MGIAEDISMSEERLGRLVCSECLECLKDSETDDHFMGHARERAETFVDKSWERLTWAK